MPASFDEFFWDMRRATQRQKAAVERTEDLPRFVREGNIPKGYFEKPDPYKDPEPSSINLRDLAAYARKHDKDVRELSCEEVEPFLV